LQQRHVPVKRQGVVEGGGETVVRMIMMRRKRRRKGKRNSWCWCWWR
jgi:hypothetical protein